MQASLHGTGAILALSFVTGCGPSSLYSWDGYDSALQANYLYSDQQQAHDALIAAQGSEITAQTAPPGFYADYGYLLLSQGQDDQAIALFRAEAARFPESAIFMNQLIERVEARRREKEDG